MAKTPQTTSDPTTPRRTRKKKTAAETRYLKIQEAAYLIAERDEFRRDSVDYWLAAETEVGE